MVCYRNILSDNSQHFSVRPFRVTGDSTAVALFQFVMSQCTFVSVQSTAVHIGFLFTIFKACSGFGGLGVA